MPAFWILDGFAATGRDGLYGIATTTRATWWSNGFGRLYSGRHGDWGVTDLAGDAPVSLAYRMPDKEPWGWFVLCARGQLAYIARDGAKSRQLPVRGPLRRLRVLGEGFVAVGAHGQIFTGPWDKMRANDQLFSEGSARFLVDVVGAGVDDFTVIGRAGEVFHWNGKAFDAWPTGTGDLHVALLHGKQVVVGGDEGVVLVRAGKAWKRVTVPTKEPIVGLAWHDDRLWAATPTTLYAGSLTKLAKVAGPGFGGQLCVGDDKLFCFGVAELAHTDGKGWRKLEHPDQRVEAAPPAWPSLGDSLDVAAKPIVHPAAELGGTLFTEDTITKRDVTRWRKLAHKAADATTLLADPGVFAVLEVEGDLHVKGDLLTFKRDLVGLVVHGDLIVDGVFNDNDHPATLTLVGGSMRAKTIITSGQLEVHGDVTCEHLIGDYNDYGATLSGSVKARLFWPENHHFELAKAPDVELVVGYGAEHRVPAKLRASVQETPAKRLKAKLRADLMNEDEPDRKRVLAALRAGESVWKGNKKTR